MLRKTHNKQWLDWTTTTLNYQHRKPTFQHARPSTQTNKTMNHQKTLWHAGTYRRKHRRQWKQYRRNSRPTEMHSLKRNMCTAWDGLTVVLDGLTKRSCKMSLGGTRLQRKIRSNRCTHNRDGHTVRGRHERTQVGRYCSRNQTGRKETEKKVSIKGRKTK